MSPDKISLHHKSDIQEEKGWVKKLKESVRRKTDAVIKMIFPKHEPLVPTNTSYLDTRPSQDDEFPEFAHVESIQNTLKDVPGIQDTSAKQGEIAPIKKSVIPTLIVDNSAQSVSRFESENAVQTRMEREGLRIFVRMQQATTVEELVKYVTKDFVEAVRRVEEIASVNAQESINLIGPKWIMVTVSIRDDIFPKYRYIQKELKRLCNFFPSPGWRIKNSYEWCVWYRPTEYSDTQVIFDVDATLPTKLPTNIHDTVTLGKGSYRNLLWAHLVPMTEAFAKRLKEINEVHYNMYHDPLTGLLNRTSYYEAAARLKELWIPFTQYFLEVIEDNLPAAILGYYGNEAILKKTADMVQPLNPRKTFLFEESGKGSFIICLDITNAREFEGRLLIIKNKLSVMVPQVPIPIENVLLSRTNPDNTFQML